MSSLTFSEVRASRGKVRVCGVVEPGSGLWSLPVCLDVRVCLGTGVWGERLRPADRTKNVCAAQNCDKVVSFV